MSIRSKSYLAKEGMTGLDVHSQVKLFFKSLILSKKWLCDGKTIVVKPGYSREIRIVLYIFFWIR